MNPVAEDILMHYGVKRRSGRYPWGSGDNPYQHSGDFLSRVNELKAQGFDEKKIAEQMGMTTTDLRMQMRVASHERRQLLADRARSMRDDGVSLQSIADELGFSSESSIRALLNENTAANKNKARVTADILRKELEAKGALDVGVGVERELGVSAGVLQEAIFILQTEGYNFYGVGVHQANDPKKQTITSVLSNPDITQKDAYEDLSIIKSVGDYYSEDGGDTYMKREYPASIDSGRIMIRYGDQGGTDKDGVIELRRGVSDLDLGASHYAQVRIMVDGTHYLKGMAMYSDDMPDGCDIIFNTNKKTGTDKMAVMKEIKDDPENPFGAYIKANGQSYYDDPNGKYIDPITGKRQSLSAINKLKEEGDWDKMSKNLSSQFLSKQPMELINRQLNLTYADSLAEFDEICAYTNLTVKKKLLLDFASECESAAVHLKSASLPRQTTQVILPITNLKDTEVYAPNYRDGEQLALIRYPHAGTFEIPILTVNNKNASARSILGPNIQDAIGINPKVAARLSGADFDGDQVIAIPLSSKVRIKSTPQLEGLKSFDPKDSYPYKPGMKVMTEDNKQKQMGKISNLITDMTLKGATDDEIVRSVKHSMVVIDATKHKLDYVQSEKDNGIKELQKKYQGYIDEYGKEVGGASTLLSRRKQDTRVPERQGSGRIDKDTGEVTYKTSGRTYIDSKGQVVKATTPVKTIISTPDVRSLSSGTPQENAYADYANKMKALANLARKEYANTPNMKYNASAAETYRPEADSLKAKLNIAASNAPREREAQRIANSKVKAKKQENEDMSKDELKKVRQQAIYDARNSVGAKGKETRIKITDGEWEAIQAGAISSSMLSDILRYADPDEVRARAMPKTTTQLSDAKVSKIKAMRASGYTNAQIAEQLGVSSSTVSKYLNA